MESNNKDIPGRMTQLDSLRAVAIFTVLTSHWLPSYYRFGISWGVYGVDLFFVLSGFLITGILFKARRHMEGNNQGVLFTVRQFYVRRCLRIFPLYYGVLLLYAVTAEGFINWLTPWLWTFTLNIYRTFITPDWGGPMSHVWSLAVIEQFYLVWPWIILLAPRRYLLTVLILTVIVGPLTEIVMTLDGWSNRAIRFFTLSNLDTLGFGAAIAYFVDHKGIEAVNRSRMMKSIPWASLLLLIIAFYLQSMEDASLGSMVLFTVAKVFILGWLVVKTARGVHGKIGMVLSARPLVFLGKISYGLYLIHKPVPYLLEKIGLPVEDISPLFGFVLYGAISIIFASLSWKYFEMPINSLKSRFPYRHKGADGPVISKSVTAAGKF